VKIELDHWELEDACSAIRQNLTCGRCTASTLLMWEDSKYSERPRGSSHAKIVTDGQGTETDIHYLVRCSFFKFNVDQPEDIVHCEGYKEKI